VWMRGAKAAMETWYKVWLDFNPFKPCVHYNGHHMSAPFFNLWSISQWTKMESLDPSRAEIMRSHIASMPL